MSEKLFSQCWSRLKARVFILQAIHNMHYSILNVAVAKVD